jgi:hypothetical protein
MGRLAGDRALTKEFGARGRERVEQLFDIKMIVGEYEGLYTRLIAEGRLGS